MTFVNIITPEIIFNNSHKLKYNFSYNFNSPSVISIVGKSGAGKTTFLEMLSGIIKVSSGSLNLSAKVSYVPQSPILLPWRNVLQSVLLPKEIENNLDNQIIEKAKILLNKFGLKNDYLKLTSALSGGMRQRVSIIQSLIQDAEIMLFDEVLSALDFEHKVDILSLLRQYFIENQKLVFYVTHSIEEALVVSDKVMIISSNDMNKVEMLDVDINESNRDLINISKDINYHILKDKVWEGIRGS